MIESVCYTEHCERMWCVGCVWGLLQARALGGEEVCLPVEGVNQGLQAGWKEQMGDKTGKMSCDHITQSLELQAKELGLLLWATGSP